MSKEDRIGSACWYYAGDRKWRLGRVRGWGTHSTVDGIPVLAAIVEDEEGHCVAALLGSIRFNTSKPHPE